MAPEIVRGEAYSELVDVFSFGIFAYECATRRRPYANSLGVKFSVHAVLRGARPEFHPDDEVPDSIKSLCQSCWQDDARARPAMSEVHRQLSFSHALPPRFLVRSGTSSLPGGLGRSNNRGSLSTGGGGANSIAAAAAAASATRIASSRAEEERAFTELPPAF